MPGSIRRDGGEVRITKQIITLCAGTSGALLVSATTITPQMADTNISAWLEWAGVDHPPQGLVSGNADQIGFWLGMLLLVISISGCAEWLFGKWWKRRNYPSFGGVSAKQATGISPTRASEDAPRALEKLPQPPVVGEAEKRRAAKIDRLLFEDRKRKAAALAAELTRHILPVPDKPGDQRHNAIIPGLSGNNYRALFDALDIDWGDRNERVQHAHAAIRADALYCTLEPGEEEHFANGAHKQAWHLFNSTLQTDLSLLKEKRLI